MEKDFLPNRDNGKHPASQVTIDFIRNVYSENSFNGFISLDMRDINGSFRHIASVECSKLEQYISLMAIYGNYHYYISANSFSKVNRSRDTLFALHNIVIDIDLHDERLLPLELEEKIENLIWRLQKDCFVHTDIPIPNYIIITGRGVQLWWCLVPSSAKQFSDNVSKISRLFIAVLEDFLAEFPTELRGFHIDTTASSNLAGVYRLPGSFNPRCNKEVETVHIHNDKLELKGFWKHCLSNSEIASLIQRNQGPFRFGNRAAASFDHIAESRVDAIRQLRDMRCAPAGEETRNDYCFAFFATLSPVIGTTAAYQRTLEFNQGFLQPFTEKELKSTLVSAFRKDYKFTTRKLIELLNVTNDEASAVGLQNAAPRPSKAIVKRRKAARNEQIITLYSSGVTQTEISNQLGISRQTVSTVIRSSAADKFSRIQVLRQEGRSTSEIARAIGCSMRTVQRYLKKLPEDISTTKKELPPRNDKMFKNPYIYGCTLGAKAERGGEAAFPAPDTPKPSGSGDNAVVLTMLLPYVSQTRYGELCNLWDDSLESFDHINTYKPALSGILTFGENDALACVENTCPFRIEAAILSSLRDAETRRGDLFIDDKEIVDQVNNFLKRNACPMRQQVLLGKPDILSALEALLQKGLVVQDHTKSCGICYFLQDNYTCEKDAALFLADLITARPKLLLPLDTVGSAIHQYESSVKLVLSSEQAQAIRTVLGNTVSIITGGPGTGKTTFLAALCAVIRILAPEAKIGACAPTGKATVHLAGVISLPTSTIHSLIGPKPHKINCDVLIVDEASMIDIKLFYNLLKSIRKSTYAVFTERF